jgi:hypothetical protein
VECGWSHRTTRRLLTSPAQIRNRWASSFPQTRTTAELTVPAFFLIFPGSLIESEALGACQCPPCATPQPAQTPSARARVSRPGQPNRSRETPARAAPRRAAGCANIPPPPGPTGQRDATGRRCARGAGHLTLLRLLPSPPLPSPSRGGCSTSSSL